jgi:acetolactate synthase-1/3 small subunit
MDGARGRRQPDGQPPATVRSISLLVENSPGVLAKIAGLIRRRGYNIHSLSVGVTDDRRVSRMLVVLEGDEQAEQVVKNLNKILEVRRVHDLTGCDTVERELALIKVSVTPGTRQEVLHVAQIFRARVVDVGEHTVVVEVSGKPDKIDALQALLRRHGIREMVRTGRVALARGSQTT